MGKNPRWLSRTLLERFEEKYIPEPNSGCWIWTATIDTQGYGQFYARGAMLKAHRVAWEMWRGTIQPALHVCHRCDNRLCVNPDHLWLGTRSENMRDMERKGRSRHPRGEQGGRAKLTEQQVIAIRSDIRNRREIATQYGVTSTLIRHIQMRLLWRHVPDAR